MNHEDKVLVSVGNSDSYLSRGLQTE